MTPNLTPRERQVVELIAQGLSHQEVAERLGITRKVVSRHLANARDKYRVPNTIALLMMVYSKDTQKPLI